MPFALATIGLLLVVVGFQDTYKQFGTQVAKDFTGDANFTYWVIAIGVVGSLGYIKSFESFSRAFMALIIVAIFLSNKGFFTQLSSAVKSGTSTPVNAIGTPLQASGGTSSGGGGDLSSLAQDASIISTVASFF